MYVYGHVVLTYIFNALFSPFFAISIFLGEENHDSFAFRFFVEEAIGTGWLKQGDILVCDNARIHEGGANIDLADFLWETLGVDGNPLRILLLPLPTRSPELNPIELLCNTLVMRLKGVKRGIDGSHAVAQAAEIVMNDFDSGLDNRTFHHCGYNLF